MAPNQLTSQDPIATFQAPAGWTLSVKVYDVAGELVGKAQHTPGTDYATWDTSTRASGLYLAVVEAKDTNGNNMGRQILKLTVKH